MAKARKSSDKVLTQGHNDAVVSGCEYNTNPC